MIRIVPIKFHSAGKHYHFNAQSLELERGMLVIVETDRGRAMATVASEPTEVAEDRAPENLKNILRIASEEDLAMAANNASRERDAHRYCQARIKERQMEMKLVKAEYAYDGSKIVFYFTADGRVDFRELVKDLAHYFHTRIEMRQIGVRDEAKLVGGLGICGRELCCCSFLTDFAPVSVKMAKEQGLALNPTKISGQCGRLLCCLGYEFESYCELKKGMPKCGKKVTYQGEEWEVTNQNILCRKISLRQQDGTCCTVTMDEYTSGKDQPAPDKAADKPRQAKGSSAPRPDRREGQKSSDAGGQGRRRPSQDRKKAQDAPPQAKDEAKDEAKRKATDATQPDTTDETKKPSRRRRRNRRRGGRRPKPENQGD